MAVSDSPGGSTLQWSGMLCFAAFVSVTHHLSRRSPRKMPLARTQYSFPIVKS